MVNIVGLVVKSRSKNSTLIAKVISLQGNDLENNPIYFQSKKKIQNDDIMYNLKLLESIAERSYDIRHGSQKHFLLVMLCAL